MLLVLCTVTKYMFCILYNEGQWGSETTLEPIDFHCMDKKIFFLFFLCSTVKKKSWNNMMVSK